MRRAALGLYRDVPPRGNQAHNRKHSLSGRRSACPAMAVPGPAGHAPLPPPCPASPPARLWFSGRGGTAAAAPPPGPAPAPAPAGRGGREGGSRPASPGAGDAAPPSPPDPEGSFPCPFCGGVGLPKRPWGEHISGSSVGTDIATLRLVVDSKGEEYFKCHGCDMSFVFANREIGTILPDLKVRPKAAMRIKHYYGDGVSPLDLLTGHRTAIVRKIRGRMSIVTRKTARDELLVCFIYNGVRTYGTLRGRRGRNGYYYELRGLDRA